MRGSRQVIRSPVGRTGFPPATLRTCERRQPDRSSRSSTLPSPSSAREGLLGSRGAAAAIDCGPPAAQDPGGPLPAGFGSPARGRPVEALLDASPTGLHAPSDSSSDPLPERVWVTGETLKTRRWIACGARLGSNSGASVQLRGACRRRPRRRRHGASPRFRGDAAAGSPLR